MMEQEASASRSGFKDEWVLSRQLLPEIESALTSQGVQQRSTLHRAHCAAIKNWLGKYRPSAKVTGFEKVRGYREAYYHLREVGAIPEAIRIMRTLLKIQKREAISRWHQFAEAKIDEKN